MTVKYWNGTTPKVCDTCNAEIITEFYDMKTTMGPWGFLCPACAMFGPGVGVLGTGFGQHYRKIGERFAKIAG